MNTKKINIAVWSVGQHAIRNILPVLARSSYINLYGVYTRNREVMRSKAEEYKCIAFTDETSFLLNDDVDAVYISSPNSLHYEQIKASLLHNKHVIVEKTALINTLQFDELIEVARRKKLLLMEAFMFRFHRQWQILKDLVVTEKYGRVLSADISFGFPHLNKEDIRYQRDLDGGALNDAGAYTICAARNLFGDDINLIGSSVMSLDEYEVDTIGVASFISAATSATVNCKWVFGGSYLSEIKVWCEKAHITVERAFAKPSDLYSLIKIHNNGELIEEISCGKDNHFIHMFSHFRDEIINNSFENEYQQLGNQLSIMEKIRGNI